MGFHLVETLVATGIVAALALGVAQLFAATTEANRRASLRTTMTLLAIQKVEELKTLETDAADGLEHLDAAGGQAPAARAVYRRRWSIEPLASDPDHLLLLQVGLSSPRAGDVRIVAVRRKRP